ncbi:MAG: hypothetical protein ACFFB5_20260 [Promethearchaeota archaeon]
MSSWIDIIFFYIIYFLPSFALTLLALITGILVYFLGKRKNLMIMNKAFKATKQSSKDWITNFELVEESTTGRTYLLEVKPDLSIKNFRVHFTMVNRHLILSKIASIIRKRRDYILLEADPSDKVVKRYQLEVLPRREEKSIKALLDMLGKLEPLELGSSRLEEKFIFRVNDSDLFLTAFKKGKNIIRNLYSMRDHLIRLSYYPLESPSIRIVAELTESLNPRPLMNILFNLTANIADLGKKNYYSKKRTIGLRIHEDKTVEKDKQKHKSRGRRLDLS